MQPDRVTVSHTEHVISAELKTIYHIERNDIGHTMLSLLFSYLYNYC